ncbi:MAG: hypothetical protein RIS92_3053 [Verrucomicrobiota bacterium]
MNLLFGHILEFFKSYDELRQLWGDAGTGSKLLAGLADEQPVEMQWIISAQKSDLFDVLAHVADALPPLTREDRASKSKVVLTDYFNSSQLVFLKSV